MECMNESIQATAELTELVGWSMGVYLFVLMAISYYASKRIQGSEDFIVAGRRLGLGLATATLLATWSRKPRSVVRLRWSGCSIGAASRCSRVVS